MARVGWWLGWSLLAGYRLIQLIVLVWSGNPLGYLLLVPEGAALYFGIVNAFKAKDRDYRLIGLWVPFCYAFGVFLIAQSQAPGLAGIVAYLLAETLSVWALFCLKTRFSVGGAAWVDLCDRGPYKWIRHPQLLARLIFVIGCTGPGLLGIAATTIAIVLTFSVVLVEESFLALRPEYRDYMDRVRYRLVPGVL